MNSWDYPLYLHFLDRELGASIDFRLASNTAEEIIKSLLLTTTSPLYCGLSLLWESPGMSPGMSAFIALLISNGVLDAVSSHPTLDEFLDSRKSLYGHDATRYGMYFRGERSHPDSPRPTEVKHESTTIALAIDITKWAMSSMAPWPADLAPTKSIRDSVLTVIKERNEEAITFPLFRPELEKSAGCNISSGILRRTITTAYAKHYLDYRHGDIATGIKYVGFFDFLSKSYPLYDIPLLMLIVRAMGWESIIEQPWTKHEKFWTTLGAWHGGNAHTGFRDRIRLILLTLWRFERKRRIEQELTISNSRNQLVTMLNKIVASVAKEPRKWRIQTLRLHEEGLIRLEHLIDRIKADTELSKEMEAVMSEIKFDNCDILLVTATRTERDSVLTSIQQINHVEATPFHGKRRTYFDLGYIGGARVFLVQCGMGSSMPGASLSTTINAIDDLNPSSIIMLGIAFGVDKKRQSIGEILVSKQIQCYEPQRVGTSSDGAVETILRGDKPSASPRLVSRFEAATVGWNEEKVSFGLIVSGEKLIDNEDYRCQVINGCTEAIGGEMEGAGLYAAAVDRNVDWIIVKGICDWADGKKGVKKKERQSKAAGAAAKFVVHSLNGGGFT